MWVEKFTNPIKLGLNVRVELSLGLNIGEQNVKAQINFICPWLFILVTLRTIRTDKFLCHKDNTQNELSSDSSKCSYNFKFSNALPCQF